MINSVICVDCICVPMCMSKMTSRLVSNCRFINNAIMDITKSLNGYNITVIYFKGIDRTIYIKKNQHVHAISTTEPFDTFDITDDRKMFGIR